MWSKIAHYDTKSRTFDKETLRVVPLSKMYRYKWSKERLWGCWVCLNGARETTSFYMIVGLITPNGKWISLDDQEITQKKQKDRFEEMFDEFELQHICKT